MEGTILRSFDHKSAKMACHPKLMSEANERRMVEGFPPSSKSVSKAMAHRKPIDYKALRFIKTPFSESFVGNAFLHIFSEQRTDAGSIPICMPLDVFSIKVRVRQPGSSVPWFMISRYPA